MAEKRRGLGRGLGALIPSAPTGDARPVDVFFPGAPTPSGAPVGTTEPSALPADPWGVPADAASDVVAETADGTRGANGHPTTSIDATERGPGTPETDSTPAGAEGGSASAGPGKQAAPTGPEDGDGRTGSDTGGASIDDGKGLLPVPGVHFAELPVGSIQPNPRQPRSVFDEDALAELVSSIREIGVLQPVVVRPIDGAVEGDPVRYELIMGERRLRATREAGLSSIPAIVRETDDADLLRDALLENLHRSELNALEEAAAYQQLLDDFGCTHEELARRIHRSRPQISNTLRLLRLPPSVQRRVAAGVLSAGHARALLGLPDSGAMERLAHRIVAEGLSVRATEEIVTLGGDAEPRTVTRRPRAGDRSGALDDLASRLSDRFETRVKIALGKSKGRLTVEFASVQDLNRILATLSPDDPGLLR